MKVEIILEKIANLKPTKYHLRWEYQDDEVSSVDSCTDIQAIRRRLIALISLMPHAEGAIMYSLLRKLKGIGFQQWELEGVLNIISKFDQNLYREIKKEYTEMEIPMQFYKSLRKVDQEKNKEDDTKEKQKGRVVELQRHFKKYGVSSTMFYKWFHDPTRNNRKDMGPNEGNGKLTAYQRRGLWHYLKQFPDYNQNYKTIPGITEIITTYAREKQDGVQE